MRLGTSTDAPSHTSASRRRPLGAFAAFAGVTIAVLGFVGRLHRLTDWTDGCIAVTNSEIRELWRCVANGTPIEIYP
jgi:hypothetical protein